jgi:hypothetical protein
MDLEKALLEKARDGRAVETPGDEGAREEAVHVGPRLDEVLLTRLDRIVALAARRGEPALHGELLDELRGLVREAETLRPPPQATTEEVVERPARRLHGT